MKIQFIKIKEMNRVAVWNLLLGLVSIPVNIVIAASLANAVSSVTGGARDFFLYNTILFIAFSLVRLFLTVFRKSYITLLESRAKQAYKQSLYGRFMQQASALGKNAAGTFTTLFRRDAEHISTFYLRTLPTFGVAVIGFVSYTLYVCVALEGVFFAICMVVLGLLSLLQPIILEKFLIKNFIQADEAEAQLAQHLTTGREGFAGFKLFQIHEWYMKRYRPRQNAYRKAGIRASASGTFNQTMDDINKFLQTLGLVSILGWAILEQWTTMDRALQIYVLSGNIYTYITTILHIKSDGATYRAAQGQLDKYLPAQEGIAKELSADKAMAAELCISGLSYQVDEKVILEELSLSISTGEKCLLRGENGIGKSTLLGLILGELVPAKGRIALNGEVLTAETGYAADRIAYCPQAAPALHCTAQELYTKVLRTQANVSEPLLYEFAGKLGLSKDDMNKSISDLSGGNQKKVVLCLALAKQAPLLLLDEPEAMLDQAAMDGLLGILSKKKCTMLVVSHSGIYESIVDSVLTFKDRQLLKTEVPQLS